MSTDAATHTPLLLATEEAARYLGISPLALLRLRREGKLRGKWVSRGYYFTRATLDAFALSEEDPDEHSGTGDVARPEGLRLFSRPRS